MTTLPIHRARCIATLDDTQAELKDASLLIRDGRIQRIVPATENTDARLTRRKSRCKPCRRTGHQPSCNLPDVKKIWVYCREGRNLSQSACARVAKAGENDMTLGA